MYVGPDPVPTSTCKMSGSGSGSGSDQIENTRKFVQLSSEHIFIENILPKVVYPGVS
jgi:hypothetical protein